jgi:hypothetical protein
MSATCESLHTLESNAAVRSNTIPRSGSTSSNRKQLLALLTGNIAYNQKLIEATAAALPEVPQGGAIAKTLHTNSVLFDHYLANTRTQLTHTANPTAIAATTVERTKQLGMTFIHLDQQYRSTQLDATIDQTPLCELVHG